MTILGLSTANLTIIADNDPNAANTITETPIVPAESSVNAEDAKFAFTLPAWSVAVLAAN